MKRLINIPPRCKDFSRLFRDEVPFSLHMLLSEFLELPIYSSLPSKRYSYRPMVLESVFGSMKNFEERLEELLSEEEYICYHKNYVIGTHSIRSIKEKYTPLGKAWVFLKAAWDDEKGIYAPRRSFV